MQEWFQAEEQVSQALATTSSDEVEAAAYYAEAPLAPRHRRILLRTPHIHRAVRCVQDRRLMQAEARYAA